VTEEQILALFHDNAFGVAARQIKMVFATCETVHFIGLSILIGAIMIFDLSMIGVLRRGSLTSVLNYTHIAAFGLVLNILSGFVLFSSAPSNYWTNPAFRLKMVLLLLAVLNVAWFEFAERRKVLALRDGEDVGLPAKLVAALSLLLWTGVIVLGRWLPVTAQGGG
jgi:hypothetical protein